MPTPTPVPPPPPPLSALDEAFFWRPRAEDLHDFEVADQRMLSEMSSAGRAGMRRALLKQKQQAELHEVDKTAARGAALNALLALQRREVIAKMPRGGRAGGSSPGPLARRVPTPQHQLRPKAMAPAVTVADSLWQSALMTAEVGYNAQDLNLPGGSLRFETVDPQLVNVDRLHYQRPLAEVRVQSYVALDPALLGQRIGVLACRDDDSLWVIDGQHHTAAAVRTGIQLMGYWVFDSTGWHDERRVFESFQAWKRGMGRSPERSEG